MMVHPSWGTRFEEAQRIVAVKARRAMEVIRSKHVKDDDDDQAVDLNDIDIVDDAVDMDDAEVDAILHGQDRSADELVARCVDSWNLKQKIEGDIPEGLTGFEPMPFTLNNVIRLLRAVPDLREELDQAMTAVGNEKKKAKSS